MPFCSSPTWSLRRQPLPSPSFNFAAKISGTEVLASEDLEESTFNKLLPSDLNAIPLHIFPLVLAGVAVSKMFGILRSDGPSFPLFLFFNKFPCLSMLDFPSLNLSLRHTSFGTHLDARFWEQAGRRKGQVLHQTLWLLSFSLVLKKSSQIICNAKEPVSLDMLVSQPTCSSSTSSSGGPVLGTRSREAGGERSDDAPTVLWHHLPVEGASPRLPEHGAHLILWLRRHLHPPTAFASPVATSAEIP